MSGHVMYNRRTNLAVHTLVYSGTCNVLPLTVSTEHIFPHRQRKTVLVVMQRCIYVCQVAAHIEICRRATCPLK